MGRNLIVAQSGGPSAAINATLAGVIAAAQEAGFENFSLCSDFETAVRVADREARPGQNVLLSPASSSFDEFSGYEERGDAFARIVSGS